MAIYSVVGRYGSAPTPAATLLLLTASSSKPLRLRELHIGSHNASTPAGAEFSVGRPTTAGTGGASYTPLPFDANDPAALFTALSGSTAWSAEPTQPSTYLFRDAIDVLASYVWVPTYPIVVAVSTRLGVRIETDNSSTKVQWVCTAIVEE